MMHASQASSTRQSSPASATYTAAITTGPAAGSTLGTGSAAGELSRLESSTSLSVATAPTEAAVQAAGTTPEHSELGLSGHAPPPTVQGTEGQFPGQDTVNQWEEGTYTRPLRDAMAASWAPGMRWPTTTTTAGDPNLPGLLEPTGHPAETARHAPPAAVPLATSQVMAASSAYGAMTASGIYPSLPQKASAPPADPFARAGRDPYAAERQHGWEPVDEDDYRQCKARYDAFHANLSRAELEIRAHNRAVRQAGLPQRAAREAISLAAESAPALREAVGAAAGAAGEWLVWAGKHAANGTVNGARYMAGVSAEALREGIDSGKKQTRRALLQVEPEARELYRLDAARRTAATTTADTRDNNAPPMAHDDLRGQQGADPAADRFGVVMRVGWGLAAVPVHVVGKTLGTVVWRLGDDAVSLLASAGGAPVPQDNQLDVGAETGAEAGAGAETGAEAGVGAETGAEAGAGAEVEIDTMAGGADTDAAGPLAAETLGAPQSVDRPPL